MTAEADPRGDELLAPLRLLSAPQALSLGAAATLSLVATFAFAAVVENSPDTFPTGPLSPGQAMAVCTAVFFWLWHAWLVLCRHDPLTPSYPSPAVAAAVPAASEFAGLVSLFFVCDRTTLLERTVKHYSPDLFWFLWALLLVAAGATVRLARRPKPQPPQPPQPPPSPPPPPLTDEVPPRGAPGEAAEQPRSCPAGHPRPEAAAAEVAVPGEAAEDDEDFHVAWLGRDQTEEWKGWMQVMFLWYHYFDAKPLYNAIRLYIAAYVWMTGFGNFSFYYIRRDFSLERFCQMQWRLNFLVVWVCLLLGNEYMLYYICMLHTTFTVVIYAGLGAAAAWTGNKRPPSNGVCYVVFAVLAAVSVLVWDVPGVFGAVWAPFAPLVQYHDPYRPQRPSMHEWRFRSWLDHLVWLAGMATAFVHPNVDRALRRLDALPPRLAALARAAVTAGAAGVLALYAALLFRNDKATYIAHHPFTSWIPITCYIVLRNAWPALRRRHLHLFEWCGKITLETYIAQFHIWMGTTGLNGSPKRLLALFPAEYPLLNFLVWSAVLLAVSFRLFHTTSTLKAAVLPARRPLELRRNAVLFLLAMAAMYVVGWLVTLPLRRRPGVPPGPAAAQGSGR